MYFCALDVSAMKVLKIAICGSNLIRTEVRSRVLRHLDVGSVTNVGGRTLLQTLGGCGGRTYTLLTEIC